MNREDVVQIFLDKILSTDWHYLQYHFAPYKKGYEHFLCASVADACTKIESMMPGYTEEFSTRLASLANREMYQPHYEQIIQLLAELYVIKHIVSIKFDDANFTHEPTSSSSKKNPEIGVSLPEKEIYFEVKCREYIRHHNNRGEASIEVPARMDGVREIAESLIKEDETAVYPRDNVVKDFLISANEKFAGQKQDNKDAITVLVIIWDDFIYEPISSLINHSSGLLTDNSFHTKDDLPVKFENIDAILLVRQSHHLINATRDQRPADGLLHPLDWGAKDTVLPKALIPINSTTEINNYLCEILEAHHIDELDKIAEYRPQDIVFHV